MIRPPRPCAAQHPRRGAVEEERRLEVDVVLEVPVLLGHLVDVGAADEHRRRLDQHVEPAEGFGDALEHRLVLVDLAEVHADGEVRTAGQRVDHGVCTVAWSTSTAATRAPASAKAATTSRPMPPAAPATTTPLPSSPAPIDHAMPSSPSLAPLVQAHCSHSSRGSRHDCQSGI